jgi:hypothetical protein
MGGGATWCWKTDSGSPEQSVSRWLKCAVPALPGLDLGDGVYLQGPSQSDPENSPRMPGYVELGY